MTVGVDPPEPVPAGMISLPQCVVYLAADQGDFRFSEPVAIYQHVETGELKIGHESGWLADAGAAFAAHEELILFLLRTGHLTAFVDGPGEALSPEFWQYPVAHQSLRSGVWKGRRLLASRDELREIVALTRPQAAESVSEKGAQGEPEPEEVIERAATRPERRGAKPKYPWARVLGYAAGWIAERGILPDTQAELELVITEQLERLSMDASPSVIRNYAREMFEGYRQQLDDE
jgi:hypothetical protein